MAMLLLTSAYYRIHAAAIMADTATAFLNSLTPQQRAKATYKFEDDQRFDWHFVPRPRKGLPLKEMSKPQRHLAAALLAAGLSQRGYIKAVSIMSLDDILRIQEKDDGVRRDPDNYYWTVFGEPSEKGTWGYRIEGHHVAQNFTIVGGHVIGAPSFFGANPAEVKQGPRKGLRVLAYEEDLGRAMIQSLGPDQQKVAIVEKVAYKDILTTASRKAALERQPSGLEVSKMNAKQREALQTLLGEYVNNVPEPLAAIRVDQVQQAGDHIYFAWAGGLHKGDFHYYRIQAQSFLIEYDDTQNEGNHIHSVWRDFNGDFGLDLLKQHYETSHR